MNALHLQPSCGASGKRTPRWLWLGAAFWLATILTVMAWITNYSFTPGLATITPAAWPEDSKIQRDAAQPTLLLFAHPRCPCTRATLEELARLMARRKGLFTAQVWFTKPAAVTADWAQTDLWRAAAEIPGVSVHVDESGAEAVRFHAQTSGHAMLYNGAGHLLFQGGITISRGHAGDNPGRTALETLLENNPPARTSTPAFGCSLLETRAQNGADTCNR